MIKVVKNPKLKITVFISDILILHSGQLNKLNHGKHKITAETILLPGMLDKTEKAFCKALDVLQKSWDLRIQYAIYNHEAYLHLQEVKKAVASQK